MNEFYSQAVALVHSTEGLPLDLCFEVVCVAIRNSVTGCQNPFPYSINQDTKQAVTFLVEDCDALSFSRDTVSASSTEYEKAFDRALQTFCGTSLQTRVWKRVPESLCRTVVNLLDLKREEGVINLCDPFMGTGGLLAALPTDTFDLKISGFAADPRSVLWARTKLDIAGRKDCSLSRRDFFLFPEGSSWTHIVTCVPRRVLKRNIFGSSHSTVAAILNIVNALATSGRAVVVTPYDEVWKLDKYAAFRELLFTACCVENVYLCPIEDSGWCKTACVVRFVKVREAEFTTTTVKGRRKFHFPSAKATKQFQMVRGKTCRDIDIGQLAARRFSLGFFF